MSKKYFFCNEELEQNFDEERKYIDQYGGKYISGLPKPEPKTQGLEKKLEK